MFALRPCSLLRLQVFARGLKTKRKMSDILFGTTTTLNRFSFLRGDSEFVKQAINQPESGTKLVFYRQDGRNGIHSYALKPSDGAHRLLVLGLASLPENLKSIVSEWAEMNASKSVETRDKITGVFLGLDEDGSENRFLFSKNSLSKGFVSVDGLNKPQSLFRYKQYVGTPYFSIDTTKSPEFQDYLSSISPDVSFIENMVQGITLEQNEASLFAYSKMYMDWLMRNQCCPGCGSKVVPVEAGTRLFCVSSAEQECPVKRSAVNNVCFPRTDPVVIVGAVSSDGKKILLGHNKRHVRDQGSKSMYSCIAGFMEPGETIEEATLREIWEETGVSAHDVKIVTSQPWPFPASLMIGCVGIVDFNGSNEKINLELDQELEDCRWFDGPQVAGLLDGADMEGVFLPPKGSIANELIKRVVAGQY